MVFNVPLNDALAAADPSSPEAASLWTRYLKDSAFGTMSERQRRPGPACFLSLRSRRDSQQARCSANERPLELREERDRGGEVPGAGASYPATDKRALVLQICFTRRTVISYLGYGANTVANAVKR
jgi:hypothetical protein